MPRGKNEEFQNRVGKLSEPLILRNIKSHFKKLNPELDLQTIDFKALIDSTLTFQENLRLIKEKLNALNTEEITWEKVKNDMEKYEELWEKFEEKYKKKQGKL